MRLRTRPPLLTYLLDIENTVSTVGNGQGRVETPVRDIPTFAGPTRALVLNRL